MRCPPEERKAHYLWELWRLALASSNCRVVFLTFKGSLGWSGGGEEEEDFLHERNRGQKEGFFGESSGDLCLADEVL